MSKIYINKAKELQRVTFKRNGENYTIFLKPGQSYETSLDFVSADGGVKVKDVVKKKVAVKDDVEKGE